MSQDIFLVVALAILIAMMFLSSRKRKKQAADLLSSVKVGSNVVLHSGITGKILSIDGDRAVIESTPGTKIGFLKGAIRSVDASAPSSSSTKTVAAKAVVAKPAVTATTKSSASTSATKKTAAAKKPAAK